jgi:hypothetical protein
MITVEYKSSIMKTSHVDVGYVMNMGIFFGTTPLKYQPYIKDPI